MLTLLFFSEVLQRDLPQYKQILPNIGKGKWPRDESETSSRESENLGDNSSDLSVSCYFHSHSLFIPSVLNLLHVSRSHPITFCSLQSSLFVIGGILCLLRSASLQMQKYPQIYHPLKNYLPVMGSFPGPPFICLIEYSKAI